MGGLEQSVPISPCEDIRMCVCVCILWHCGDNYTQIIHKSYKIVYVYKCPHKKVTDVPIEK